MIWYELQRKREVSQQAKQAQWVTITDCNTGEAMQFASWKKAVLFAQKFASHRAPIAQEELAIIRRVTLPK